MSDRPSDLYNIVIRHLAEIVRLGTPAAIEIALAGKWLNNVIEREPVMNIIAACKREMDAHAALVPVTPASGELARIGELIRTQDNRITDAPIFIVQQKRTYVTEAGYNEDRVQWIRDNDDHREASEEEAATCEAFYDKQHRAPRGWARMHVHDAWEFVTACFTEQGCKDYLARDGHNLREPRIYAAGSYRNAEWRSVRAYLAALRPAASTGDVE